MRGQFRHRGLDRVRDTGHRCKHVLDLVFDQNGHVFDGHRGRGDGKAHHRIGIGIRLDDLRRVGLLRQCVGDAADGIAHVGGGDVQIDTVIELHGDSAGPEGRAGGNGFDPGNAGHRAFNRGGQLAVNRLGGGGLECRRYRHHGPVDIRQFAHVDAIEGGKPGDCPVTEDLSDRLLRLPFYNDLTESLQAEVVAALFAFEDWE